MQNFNYFVGSLEQTMKRDANGAVIYGPAPAAIYPARPPATAPAVQLQAYIEACQTADELRDAQFPHGGSALNHHPLDSELKTILLDALSSTSRLGAYKNLYQQYCNRSHNGKTYMDLYNDIHDLVMYDSDGVKSSTRDSDAEIEDSDGSRSTRARSRSSNSHSSRRQAQIQHAASVRQAQQIASSTSTNSNSTTSHPILVMDRRATEPASLVRTARALVMGPSGAHRPSATRRTAARHSPQQTRGKPISFKSMGSRRSQRHHRSSPHSRTARGTKSSSSSHSG